MGEEGEVSEQKRTINLDAIALRCHATVNRQGGPVANIFADLLEDAANALERVDALEAELADANAAAEQSDVWFRMTLGIALYGEPPDRDNPPWGDKTAESLAYECEGEIKRLREALGQYRDGKNWLIRYTPRRKKEGRFAKSAPDEWLWLGVDGCEQGPELARRALGQKELT